MKNSRKKDNTAIMVKTESRKDFFARGKRIAKKLDSGKEVSSLRIISFEDTQDLIEFLTKTKQALLDVLRKKPDSISELAHKLHRSRAAIDKDVRQLESVGIVKSEYIINPGHGRCRIVRAVDSNPIKLYVETVI
ncbi:MAG: HTH domain-containing protein [Gammaproteobacteria bacterium]|nr:HTH domain-containing protein [Gammaproteobacteria bacterium]